MNSQNQLSFAEEVDNNLRWYGLIALIMACKFAVSAAMTVVDGALLRVLDKTEIGLMFAAATIVVILIPFTWLKYDRRERMDYLKLEGFVPQSFRNAVLKAFFLTFLVMSFLAPLSQGLAPQRSAEFFLNVMLSFMLLTLTAAFCWSLRTD